MIGNKVLNLISSRDVEMLGLLRDFPLRFHGARRACRIGDTRHSLDLCSSIKCEICSIFHAQYAARKAGKCSWKAMIGIWDTQILR